MIDLRSIRNGVILCVVCVLASLNVPVYASVNDTTNEGQKSYESATEYDYPPFSVTDSGEADGFSVELLKAVAEEMGLKINFKIDEWSIIKDELKIGKLDVLPLVGYTTERDQYFDFTVPYIVMRGNIFVRKSDESIKSENDLQGKSIIVMKGDNAEEYAKKIGLSDNLILTKTYVDAFMLLDSGKYDAVLAQGLVGEKILNDYNLKDIAPVYIYEEGGIKKSKLNLTGYEQKFCFAVKEGDQELLAMLNEGLAIVSENGTYDRLYKKWFPFLIDDSIRFLEIAKYLLYILIPIILFGLGISYLMIKRQVKQKTREITRVSDKLEFERNKYYSTLVSIADGVVVIDNLGFIEIMNPKALEILEIDSLPYTGRHYSELIKIFNPAAKEINSDPIKEVLDSGKEYQNFNNILQPINKKHTMFVQLKVSPVFHITEEKFDIVIVISDVSKVQKHIDQIEYLSFHDSLTELYNRRFFEEEMRRLDTPRNYPISIAMADLNGLKLINDAYGHLAGDEMLKNSAQIFRFCCRESDIIARWGGDEFVIILPETSSEQTTEIIKRIQETSKLRKYSFGQLSIAIGHDTKVSEDQKLESIFVNAENLMYKQKASQKEGSRGKTQS